MDDNRVIIFDTTLRDGEQAPGCSMHLDEKVRLARQLERLGVDVIEAGFPIASDGDFAAVEAVAVECRRTTVAALCRTMKAEGRDVIDLSAGEPDFRTPDFAAQAGIAAIVCSSWACFSSAAAS